MSEELTKFSAAQLARMIGARAVSPVEIVEAHLRRIERVNPQLNAVVTLAPDALEQARAAERALMRGEPCKILHGVPLTIKDTIAVRGMRATSGSRAHADFVPLDDAPSVALLRAAGAIIIGKTNTSELALDYTADNPVFGRTNNPLDVSRTPGGSSGGCAAAVSAYLTSASIGSDLAGSIRIPAYFCGVAGLKPTAGRINGAGHFPPMDGVYARGASLGPLARTVEDLALLFQVLKGDAAKTEAASVEETIARDVESLRGVRVAWYADDGAIPVTSETRAAVKRAAEALQSAGLLASEERPPGVERATELWLSMFSRATGRFVHSVYDGREGEAGSAARAILERANTENLSDDEDEKAAWSARDELRAKLLRWMETTPLIVAPVGAVAAYRHDTNRKVEIDGQAVGIFRAFGYAQAYNVFDLPVVTVPAGRTRENLPVGVQIIGRPDAEKSVLAAARIVEKTLGGWRQPTETLSTGNDFPL